MGIEEYIRKIFIITNYSGGERTQEQSRELKRLAENFRFQILQRSCPSGVFYKLISPYSVICVFQGYLILDNQLVSSSWGKITSSIQSFPQSPIVSHIGLKPPRLIPFPLRHVHWYHPCSTHIKALSCCELMNVDSEIPRRHNSIAISRILWLSQSFCPIFYNVS